MALDKFTQITKSGIVTTINFECHHLYSTGIATFSAGSISALDGTFSGDVSIGGTLTYQDVTNIDSVGLVTARLGLNVTAGVSTFAAAIDANGGVDISGGSGLVASTAKISDLTDNRVVIGGSSGELEDSANLTFDGSNLGVGSKVTVTNANADADNTNSLGAEINAAWIRLGDVTAAKSFSNGLGIKFHDQGTAHWSVGSVGSGFYISNTSNDAHKLFPSGRTDALAFNSSGAAVFASDITAGGNLYIPDKIYHSGDTNTAIRFPAADAISFETGGHERLRVGAGTAGTCILLAGNRVNNAHKTLRLTLNHYTFNTVNQINILGGTTGSGYNRVHIGGNDASTGETAATDIKFYTAANATTANGTERLRIDSSGKVGIGITNPQSDLQIITAGQTQDGTFRIGGSVADLGLVLDYDQSGSTTARIYANADYDSDTSVLKICSDLDDNPNQLVLAGSGNVGVNTDFTGSQTWRNGQKLEIFGGGGNVTGELHLGANRGDSNQSVGSINFFDNSQDSTHRHIALIEADKSGSTSNKRGGDLIFFTKKDNTAAPDEKLRIDSSGNVLVGTTDTTLYSNTQSSGTGIMMRGGQVIDIARSGDLQLTLNRLTNEGANIALYQAGALKGTIGTKSGGIYFGTGGDTERLRIATSGSLVSKGGGAVFEQVETNSYNAAWAAANGKIAIKGDLSGGNYFGWRQKNVASGSVTQSNAQKKLPTLNDFTYPNSSNGMLIASTSKIGFAAAGESPQYSSGVTMLFDSSGLALGTSRAFDCNDTVSNATTAKIKLFGSGGQIGLNLNSMVDSRTRLEVRSSTDTPATGMVYFKVDHDSNNPVLVLRTANGGNTADTMGLRIINTAAGNGLRVDADGSGGNPFIVDPQGYVGVGRETPSTRLHIRQNNGVAYNKRVQTIAYNGICIDNASGYTSGGVYTGMQFNNTGDSQNRICSIGMVSKSSSTRHSDMVFATDDSGNREEKMRLTSNGTLHTHYSQEASPNTSGLTPQLQTSAGVVGPMFWMPIRSPSSGFDADGPGYADMADGDHINFMDPEVGVSYNSMFQAGFFNSYNQPNSNTTGKSEVKSWNRIRIWARVKRADSSTHAQVTVKFRLVTYHYNTGWKDQAQWDWNGTDSARGGRWVVSPWLSGSDMNSWADVPGFGLKYNNNGNSGCTVRVQNNVHFQFAYFN